MNGRSGTSHGPVRRYVEMVAAMLVGMAVLEPVRAGLVDALGWGEVFEHIELLSMAMATEMCLGMIVWMRFRSHDGTSLFGMCAAMYVPFILLFIPFWAGVVSGEMVLIGGHVLMLPAMAVVMLRPWRHEADDEPAVAEPHEVPEVSDVSC